MEFQPTVDITCYFFPNFQSSSLQATVLFIKVRDLSLFVSQSDYFIFFETQLKYWKGEEKDNYNPSLETCQFVDERTKERKEIGD